MSDGLLPPCSQATSSILEEAVEPVGSQFSITDCVLNILVSHVVLDGPCILPVVGQLVSATMAQHVRMHRELDLGILPCPQSALAPRVV